MKDLFRTTVWRIIWCKGHIGFKLTCQQWTDLQLVCLWTPTGFTSSVLRSAGLCSIRKSAAHSRTSLVVVLITWSPASHVADGRDADHAVSTECRVTEQERKKQLVGICPNESVSFTPIRTSPLHHSLVCCSVSEQIQRKMGRRKNSWKWCDGHSKPASGGRLWLSFIQRWTSLNFSFSLVCRRSLMGLSDPPAAALSWNPAVFVLQTMSSKRSLWNDSTVSVCGRRQLLKRHCWRIFLLLIKQIPSFILLKFHHRDSAEARLQKLRSGFTCVLQKTLVTCSRFWMRSRSHQRWSIMQTWRMNGTQDLSLFPLHERASFHLSIWCPNNRNTETADGCCSSLINLSDLSGCKGLKAGPAADDCRFNPTATPPNQHPQIQASTDL